jgi:hypothetical protein
VRNFLKGERSSLRRQRTRRGGHESYDDYYENTEFDPRRPRDDPHDVSELGDIVLEPTRGEDEDFTNYYAISSAQEDVQEKLSRERE